MGKHVRGYGKHLVSMEQMHAQNFSNLWFAQFFKGWLHIPYNRLSMLSKDFIIPYIYIFWTYQLYTRILCWPMTDLFDVFSTARLDRTGELDRLWEGVGRSGTCRFFWTLTGPHQLRYVESKLRGADLTWQLDTVYDSYDSYDSW